MSIFNDELIKTTKSPPHLDTIVKAKVLSVYDADTVTVVYNINNNPDCPFIINVRLTGIDAPEKKTSNALEKQASILVTKYVSNLILGMTVDLLVEGWDKYGGRINGTIKLESQIETVNAILLKNNLVKKFDGKTNKELWTDEQLNAIILRINNVI